MPEALAPVLLLETRASHGPQTSCQGEAPWQGWVCAQLFPGVFWPPDPSDCTLSTPPLSPSF